MIGKKIIIAGDGHFHLYPCYDLPQAISNLMRNLGLMAASARGLAPEEDVFKIAFLAESKQHDYFHKIQKKEIDFRTIGLEVLAGGEEHCVALGKQGKQALCLIAGRQIVTREKLEILGLGMEEVVPDGLSAEEAVEKVIATGGRPVLAFAPGKWLFKRAGLVRHLAEKYGQNLIVGDSALRPLGWGAPEIMRRARANHIAVLPGSDPLPMPGEEKSAGCYGFIYQGLFDTTRPLTAMNEIILNSPAAILPAVRRRSIIDVAGKLYHLWRAK